MFFNKKEDRNNDSSFIKIASLLIHLAKIDENYTDKEEKIIKQTLLDLGAKSNNLDNLVAKAKQCEKDTNQILDFTKEVKNMTEENKIKIIETLWKIIYSNDNADVYETNLMRRLTGLLYIDNKLMGDIKERIKKEILK